jgi:uncharacterized OB-fold protein
MTRDVAAPPSTQRRLHGEYWSTLPSGRVELSAQECTRCGACYLPEIATCVTCRGKQFRLRRLKSAAELYTYTIVRDAGGVWPARYTIGYADFPEEKVRVCGHFREVDEALLKIGMRLGIEEAVLYTEAGGTAVTCFRFHAAEVAQ